MSLTVDSGPVGCSLSRKGQREKEIQGKVRENIHFKEKSGKIEFNIVG